MNNDSEFVVLKGGNYPGLSLWEIRNLGFVPQGRPWQEGEMAISKQTASHTDENFCTDLVYVRRRMYPTSTPVITIVWEMVKQFTKAKKFERMDICADFKWLYSNHFIWTHILFYEQHLWSSQIGRARRNWKLCFWHRERINKNKKGPLSPEYQQIKGVSMWYFKALAFLVL